MTAEQKLEGCPFCGGKASILENRNMKNPRFRVFCRHKTCGTVVSKYKPTEALAIAAWNRRASPEPTGWQPIATAPKDGTEVLVYIPQFNSQSIATWCTWHGAFIDDNGFEQKATHWQPLPAPPKEQP